MYLCTSSVAKNRRPFCFEGFVFVSLSIYLLELFVSAFLPQRRRHVAAKIGHAYFQAPNPMGEIAGREINLAVYGVKLHSINLPRSSLFIHIF